MAVIEMFKPHMQGLHVPAVFSTGPKQVAAFCNVRPRQMGVRAGTRLSKQFAGSYMWQRDGLTHEYKHRLSVGSINRRSGAARATAEAGDTESADKERATKTREELNRRTSEVRTKIYDFFEKRSEYKWLLGPAVITATVFIPPASINLVGLLQKRFLLGFIATLSMDVLFVLAADLFLVFADKLGYHQKVGGGATPWVGPWEVTGYPKGYPTFLNYIAYAAVGVGFLAILLAFLVGKLGAALAVFGPYLGILLTQVAYERLVSSDKLAVFPLVPVIYTVYRFRQLARGRAFLPFIANGSGILTFAINISTVLWALYLALYLTQLPWLYSTWNSNRAT